MNHTLGIIAAILVLAVLSACSTYTGDNLLKFPEQRSSYDQSKIISKAKRGVSDILDRFGVPEERKTVFDKITPKEIIHDSEPLTMTRVDHQLVVAGASTNISFATDSIIISTGILHISHSSNNIIVCGSDVYISHDGSMGKGSLVISKGKSKISHAGNTLIYAINGVVISHAHNVKAFNTRERKTSWGHINNIIVAPLFQEETAPGKSPRPTGSAGG
ncbi:hypothetical protein [Desulfospira joergensenii]|uniref:hypothetical protein n=1 Tax=Desulfospira joergensenii TaxID=53329 RepID=UPI000686BAB7|nr:hypothetical protein [Desulfospira joergensenii]